MTRTDVLLVVGVGVAVGVGASVGAGVGVGVALAVGVGARVGAGVGVGVGARVGAGVGVGVGARVGFGVGASVAIGVGVGVGVGVGDAVAVVTDTVTEASVPSTTIVAESTDLLPPEPLFDVALRMCVPTEVADGIVTVVEKLESDVVRTVTIPSWEPSSQSWIHSRLGRPRPLTVIRPPGTVAPSTVKLAEVDPA